MHISREKFETLASQALDELPDEWSQALRNVAILVEDRPSKEQRRKLKVGDDYVLFGLFEGHAQGRGIYVGPVLPDRITLFRLAIASQCDNMEQLNAKIINTLKHEIAHHLGSDEPGARKAEANKKLFLAIKAN